MKLFLFLCILVLIHDSLSALADYEHDHEHDNVNVNKYISAFFDEGVSSIMASNKSRIIASLRELPSEVHLCSAFFISQDALLTTATCIYGKTPENFFVHTLAPYMERDGILVGVRAFYPHPDFDGTGSNNDVGIIKLKKGVDGAIVHELPLPWENLEGMATFFQWMWSLSSPIYEIQANTANIIPNSKCSLLMRKYVECDQLCIGGKPMYHGSMDQGLPVSGLINNVTYILAIYNRHGINYHPYVESYEKISQHVPWIRSVLNNDSLALRSESDTSNNALVYNLNF